MKTLILYTFHQYNDNVEFFLKHALINNPNYTYLIIINNPSFTIPIQIPDYITVINRNNIGYDFGAWSYGLFNFNYIDYDYFIFINSTIKGPFFPVWSHTKDWIDIFTSLIDDQHKLVGPMIGIYDNKPHVQSMFMVTDQVGLNIGMQNRIFTQDIYDMEKLTLIKTKEIGFSTAILSFGYNIKCLLQAFNNIDFRQPLNYININPFLSEQYFKIPIHPFEVIFIKSQDMTIPNKFIQWSESNDHILENFDWINYLKLNPDVAKVNNTQQFAISHWLNHGKSEGRIY